ncbi:MAG TPA: MmcQ/YjbR family DNA-binding protein [Streptosporangiaceae bacterium]|jgi:predicted DNA-binding protein (MmcQ/YjbR family)
MGDLSQAREFALSLPGTSEEPHFDMTSFRVKGKIFATAPADETRLHVFVDESEVAATVAEQARAGLPRAFEALVWGQRVRGLRVLLAAAPDDRVRELLAEAWRRKAGRRLAAELDAAADRDRGR